jgi:hypothetical protein
VHALFFPREDLTLILDIALPFPKKILDEGFKYLGFILKPNEYDFEDRLWLYKNVEAHISLWVNIWLSRGGRLIPLKSVVQSIPVCWDSIAKILKGILTKIYRKKRIPIPMVWYSREG